MSLFPVPTVACTNVILQNTREAHTAQNTPPIIVAEILSPLSETPTPATDAGESMCDPSLGGIGGVGSIGCQDLSELGSTTTIYGSVNVPMRTEESGIGSLTSLSSMSRDTSKISLSFIEASPVPQGIIEVGGLGAGLGDPGSTQVTPQTQPIPPQSLFTPQNAPIMKVWVLKSRLLLC